MRHGQWVKFDLPEELVPLGVHTSTDGKAVGIFQRAFTDVLGEAVPEHIAPVNGNGLNLKTFDEHGTPMQVTYDPNAVKGLVPAELPGDVPLARRVGTSLAPKTEAEAVAAVAPAPAKRPRKRN